MEPGRLLGARGARRLAAGAAVAAFVLALGPAQATGQRSFEAELPPPGYCGPDTSSAADPIAQTDALTCLINYVRVDAGLKPLRLSSQLTEAAALRLAADARCDELSHTPCGTTFESTFEQAGYIAGRGSYKVGENLASGRGRWLTARHTILAWLGSPDHRAIVLDRAYTELGLSVSTDTSLGGVRNVALWVGDFGWRGPSGRATTNRR